MTAAIKMGVIVFLSFPHDQSLFGHAFSGSSPSHNGLLRETWGMRSRSFEELRSQAGAWGRGGNDRRGRTVSFRLVKTAAAVRLRFLVAGTGKSRTAGICRRGRGGGRRF